MNKKDISNYVDKLVQFLETKLTVTNIILRRPAAVACMASFSSNMSVWFLLVLRLPTVI